MTGKRAQQRVAEDMLLDLTPDLEALIKAWALLPEHIRLAIKALLQIQLAETSPCCESD